MFVETKKEGEVQKAAVDPFELKNLIAWLETKDHRTRYDYCTPWDCLMCRYFREMGLQVKGVEPFFVHIEVGPIRFSDDFERIAKADQTYGAALQRARAVAKEKLIFPAPNKTD